MVKSDIVRVFLVYRPAFFKNGARSKNGLFFPMDKRERCLVGNFACEGDHISEPIFTKLGKQVVKSDVVRFEVESISENGSNVFINLTFRPNNGFNEKEVYYYLLNSGRWFRLSELESYLAGKIQPKLSKREKRRQSYALLRRQNEEQTAEQAV